MFVRAAPILAFLMRLQSSKSIEISYYFGKETGPEKKFVIVALRSSNFGRRKDRNRPENFMRSHRMPDSNSHPINFSLLIKIVGST